MKKLFALMVCALAGVLCATVQSRAADPDVLAGVYANDAGTVTIAKAPKGQDANYDVTIADKSGKCQVKIVAATNKVTADGKNGAEFHPNTIVAVEGQTFSKFSLWPEDKTIRLADDALPFNELDPACQAFRDNMVFTRK